MVVVGRTLGERVLQVRPVTGETVRVAGRRLRRLGLEPPHDPVTDVPELVHAAHAGPCHVAGPQVVALAVERGFDFSVEDVVGLLEGVVVRSGKSSLLACLTNANPVIAEYPLSTLSPLPGMMPFEDIQIQLVDLPPIGNEATDGWVSGILRYADALLLVIDLTEDPDVQAALLIEQLTRWSIHPIPKTGIGQSRDKAPSGVFKRTLIAANKADAGHRDDVLKLEESCGQLYPCIAVSALKKENLEELKKMLQCLT